MTDLNQLWEQFETADYATRLQLYQQALASPEMDGEWAFELLNLLYDDTAAAGERQRFNGLLAELNSRFPAVYAAEADYFVEWTITNHLIDNELEHLPSLLHELAAQAADCPDVVASVADKLAYHGQLPQLVPMLNTAWPYIRDADEIDTWEIEEFAMLATHFLILHYLETTETPSATDPALTVHLEQYIEFEPADLTAHLAQLTGEDKPQFQPADFNLPRKQKELPDAYTAILTRLLHQFLHYLQAETDVSYGRAGLAYWPLAEVLFAHIEQQLPAYRPQGRKKGGKYRRRSANTSPLYPAADALTQYLGRLLDLITPAHYRAAALVAVLPHWLTFLAQTELLDAQMQQRCQQETAVVIGQLRALWADPAQDPALAASLDAWS